MENAINNAMITAIQLLDKQAVISNNLANISTTGFKEQLNYIINKSHNNTNILDKEKVKEYYNFSQGTLNYTERNLDCVVQNHGWLVVKDPHGQEAYTKNGHIKINKYGKLTIQNHPIVGNNCDISIPNGSNIKISSTGKIILINKTTKNVENVIIGALKLVHCSDNNLLKRKNGLFYFNKKIKSYKHKNLNHDNNIRIKSGTLESSNVNPTKNMIDMISNARQFDIQMKIISMCDKNTEYANQLLNIHNQ